jgi:hypothetical protein
MIAIDWEGAAEQIRRRAFKRTRAKRMSEDQGRSTPRGLITLEGDEVIYQA